MANNITMTYGDYSFSPVPLLSYTQEIIKNSDGKPLYIQYSGRLQGLLVSPTGGFSVLVDLLNTLKEAVNCEQCKLFEIKCDENVVLSVFPQNFELTVDEGNWIQTIQYSIQLEWIEETADQCPNPPYIRESTNEWSVEPLKDPAVLKFFPDFEDCSTTGERFLFNITHNLSAVGVPYCTGTGEFVEPWESAKSWVLDNTGLDTSVIDLDVFGLSGSYTAFDHFRQITINKTAGSYSLTESWTIVYPQTTGLFFPASEDFSIELSEEIVSGIFTIVISGTITGFENMDYSTGSVNTSRYENALFYWDKVRPLLLCRAQYANTNDCGLNFEPVSKTVGHNPTSGVITYSYTYNNSPVRLIPGSRYENIQISYENPVDVYVEHLVLGRSRGPILQSLRTSTKSCQTVNVEVTMSGCSPTGCLSLLDSPRDIVAENILCCLESSLTGSYDQVFKSADSEQWEPITRRYSRTVTWCYQDCTGSGINTNICQ